MEYPTTRTVMSSPSQGSGTNRALIGGLPGNISLGVPNEDKLRALSWGRGIAPANGGAKYSFDPAALGPGNTSPAPDYKQEAVNSLVRQMIQPQAQSANSSVAAIARQLTPPSSAQVYQQTYNQARDNGATTEQAARIAAQRAALAQDQNVRGITDQLLNGGVKDGVITPEGVGMLTRLAQEGNSDIAGIVGQMFSNPRTEDTFNREIAKQNNSAANAPGNALAMADVNFGNTSKLNEQQQQYRIALANLNFEHQLQAAAQAAGLKTQAEIDNLRAKAQYVFDLSKAGGLSDEASYMNMRNYVAGIRSGRENRRSDALSTDEEFRRPGSWLDRYDKNNKDVISGQWLPGKGPDDPEYISANERYRELAVGGNPEASTQSEDDQVRDFVRRARAAGRSNEEIVKNLIDAGASEEYARRLVGA